MEKSEFVKALENLTEALKVFGEALEEAEFKRKEGSAEPEYLFVGATVQVSDDPWYDDAGSREYLSGIAGDIGEIIDGPDPAGDWKVEFGANTPDYWVNGKCLRTL